MSEHETLQANVVALAAGRLSDEERREVEEHVARCPDCAGVLALAQEVAALSPHPSVLELRGYAQGNGPQGVERVASHIRQCPSCSLEVEAWKRQPRSRRGGRVAIAAATLAASLLLGFWIARRDSTSSDAPQTLHFAAATRGAEAQPEAEVDPRRDLTIHAEWMPLDSFESVGPIALEIRNAAGAVVWSSEIDAPSAVEILRAGTGFRASVPAGSLAPGSHEFRMFRRSRPHEPAVVSGSFVVGTDGQRQSPEATNGPQ